MEVQLTVNNATAFTLFANRSPLQFRCLLGHYLAGFQTYYGLKAGGSISVFWKQRLLGRVRLPALRNREATQ